MEIQPFGLMVLMAFVVSPLVGLAAARRLGTPTWVPLVWGVGLFVAVPLGRMIPTLLLGDSSIGRMTIMMVGQGLWTLGLGLVAVRRWGTLDTLVVVTATAWTLVRTGCAMVHDHPGAPSSWPTAVAGICRDAPGDLASSCHDLGMLELFALIPVVLSLLGLAWSRIEGWSAAVFLVVYPLWALFVHAVFGAPPQIWWGGVLLLVLGTAFAGLRRVLPSSGPEA